MTIRLLTIAINNELDVVAARQRAREIAGYCRFGLQDQAKIATAISELARNVYNYAGSGRIEFSIEGETAPQILTMQIKDRGPGIRHLDTVLSGYYKSATGMGVGLLGAKRLMDRFEIDTGVSGTDIRLQKIFPREAPLITPKMAIELSDRLAQLSPNITVSEVQQQNRELLGTLEELRARQEELVQLTQELEDTNRGVVALYAELDERADYLRRADDLKSRFLSNMSHEFRTPLSSIRALCKLLLDRVDGDLNEEQERQVNYILQSAQGLSELVNDLLDLAKIEAGKIEIKPTHFTVTEMFSALRGMLKPLLVSERLALIFEDPNQDIELHTDEAKVSQVLRNFISNALKFTEEGGINVSADFNAATGMVSFHVSDTGLGIAKEDIEFIFEEFNQVENHMQRKVKGTGLGLPLCRKFASLLQGNISVESEPGQGSVFTLNVPAVHQESVNEVAQVVHHHRRESDSRQPLLIVEDNVHDRLVYEKIFTDSPFRAIMVQNLREARNVWKQTEPVAVILDILLRGEDTWHWLADTKNDPGKKSVPIIVATSVEDRRKGLALGADAYFVKPVVKDDLLKTLSTLIAETS